MSDANSDPTETEGSSIKAPVYPLVGVARDLFVVPDSFFEPLPDEILRGFGLLSDEEGNA